jgi:hypothetical protein
MKHLLTLVTFLALLAISGYGQKNKYWTSGLEIPFEEAKIDDASNPNAQSTLRFAPIINIQTMYNVDMSEHFGLFTGLAIRNVGYIYNDYQTNFTENETPIKKKFRSYNLGIPIGVKVGTMDGFFLYGGYEIEFPFAYKEKTFNTAGEKSYSNVYWFTNRVNVPQQSWLIGVQFPYGFNLKFKYYFTEFNNQNFEENGVKPYEGLSAHVWYISLNTMLFKNLKFDAGQ